MQKLIKKLLLSAAVLFCVLFLVSESQAEMKAGSFSVNPYLNLMITRDSNIYYTSTSAKMSLVRNIMPGVNISYPFKTNELTFGYWAQILAYSEDPSTNNSTNQNMNLGLNLNPSSRLSFGLSGNVLMTNDPATSELTSRQKRTQNTTAIDAKYTFSEHMFTALNYSMNQHRYDLDALTVSSDRNENDGMLNIGYSISPKSSVLLGLGSGAVEYIDESTLNSSNYTKVNLGFVGEITHKTTGNVNAGVKNRKYPDRSGRDTSLPVLALSTLTKFSGRTSLQVAANRNFQESFFSDSLYYVATGLNIKLNQKISYDWGLILSGGLENNAYPDDSEIAAALKSRNDNLMTASAELKYYILKWFSVSGTLSYYQKDSNLDEYDYHYALLGLSAMASF